jgi:hypothetical protein
MDQLLRESHIISLHVPLTPQSHHLINKDALDIMKQVHTFYVLGMDCLSGSRSERASAYPRWRLIFASQDQDRGLCGAKAVASAGTEPVPTRVSYVLPGGCAH